jgi:hypothetical protein
MKPQINATSTEQGVLAKIALALDPKAAKYDIRGYSGFSGKSLCHKVTSDNIRQRKNPEDQIVLVFDGPSKQRVIHSFLLTIKGEVLEKWEGVRGAYMPKTRQYRVGDHGTVPTKSIPVSEFYSTYFTEEPVLSSIRVLKTT